MALGDHAIGGSVAETFAQTSGIGASAEGLALLIGGATIASAFLWCAYYLRRVLASGFNKGDAAHMATGLVLSVTLLFLALWVAGLELNT